MNLSMVTNANIERGINHDLFIHLLIDEHSLLVPHSLFFSIKIFVAMDILV